MRCVFFIWVLLAGLEAAANTFVQIRTPGGDLECELFDQDKPVTVRNFVRLIEAGAYANGLFHRLVPGFVAQGGGFAMRNGLLVGSGNFGAITNEFDVGPRYSNTFGTIAMAKTTNGPDTATSQFFINLADNSANLDFQNGGFTVFGRVLRDQAGLLPWFNSRGDGTNLVNLSSFLGPTFSRVPVTYEGSRIPETHEFFYHDITLLRVAVSNGTDRAQEISWNSAPGLTNVVEFTDGFAPPAWQELAATNGSGQRMAVTDTNSAPGRFYRVRVK